MALPRQLSWLNEFRAFIMRGSVVDLAVGIIIGAAFTGVVNSLVKDIFNPILGLMTGGVDFSNVYFTLNGQHYATLDDARKAGAPTVNVGLFLNAVFQFIIVGFAVFWMVRLLNRMQRHPVPPAAAPPPTPTETLLTEIRDLLKTRT